jgi:hypothetical protein
MVAGTGIVAQEAVYSAAYKREKSWRRKQLASYGGKDAEA